MKPGDVVNMTHCDVVVGRNRFWFKAPKKQRFVFLFLGVESDDARLSPEAALNAIGWKADVAMGQASGEQRP